MVRRIIEPAFVEYIDNKLKNNPAAQAALKAKDFRQIIVFAAEACVGIREKTGKNDGEKIEWIQETVGDARGEPYCVGGVQSVLAYAELKTGRKSPLIATELATGMWAAVPPELKVKNIPLPGAFAFWQDLDKKGKKLITGHAEIVRSAANSMWNGIGFNTSGSSYPGGPVVREGNGVYYTSRNYSNTKSRILLGFAKPI